MRNGKVVEEGPSRDIFESPRDDYPKALLAAAFDIKATHRGALAG
jgi:microcin C transport system ATP-binding protein